ncbi:MAG: WD40 repeat domain-containing protein [Cytophagales bacterium]|nr:WD40 repeat domain-containing protein [Cytophaga sp.]
MQRIQVEKIGVYKGHRDSIYALEKGISETVFFTSGADGMVVSWNMEQPDEGVLIAKLPNSVYALYFNEEENELFIGQNFEGIHVIDVASKLEKRSAQITKEKIFDIKKFNDWLLVATGDGHLIVLDIKHLSVIIKLKISDHSLRAIAIHPSGKQLAIGGSDHLIHILDLPSLRILKTIPGHTNSVFTVVYSFDGALLLSAGRDAHLKVWETDLYHPVQSIAAHMYSINHIAYSPSGNYFATVSMDKSIKVWDAKEFRLLKVIDKSRHAGHATSINKLLWSGFHNRIISASDDRTISIWDIALPE